MENHIDAAESKETSYEIGWKAGETDAPYDNPYMENTDEWVQYNQGFCEAVKTVN